LGCFGPGGWSWSRSPRRRERRCFCVRPGWHFLGLGPGAARRVKPREGRASPITTRRRRLSWQLRGLDRGRAANDGSAGRAAWQSREG
jgi:hypothetical protein